MKKVIILGAKGTLGQYLVEEFKKDYEVLAWDREDFDITGDGFKEKIISVIPDIIINATGYNAVDKAETDEKEKALAYLINGQAPKTIAEAAKEINGIFVNFSTDFVFKGDKQEGYKEDDATNPVSEYGKSKLEGEKNVQAVGGKYYIIRPSRIFGRAGTGASSKKSFVDIMLGKINDEEIRLVNEEKGSPTYAPDLARFVRALIESGKPYGIYHGTNSGACNWYEWAQEIFAQVGRSPKLIPVKSSEFFHPAPRPMFSELINTKMPEQRSWQEALREYLQNIF
jgi:dTDP-4-dehydrorhamnose reductase